MHKQRLEITSFIERSLHWFLASDIRIKDQDQSFNGGVRRGYDWKNRSYQFLYSEITGYAISLLANAREWLSDEKFISLSRQSANVLISLQDRNSWNHVETYGAIPQGVDLPAGMIRQRYYSFDNAMCLQGLMDLYTVQRSQDLLQAAHGIGRWLLDQMQLPSGAFTAIVNCNSEYQKEAEDEIFGDESCQHAKHAIGLLKLHRVTNDKNFYESAVRVCDWVLGLQDHDGAIRASTRTSQIVTHTHCYALEGLLFAYHRLGEHKYLEAAMRGAEWLRSEQNNDGSLNIAYKRNWFREGRRITELLRPRTVSDATAQAIRIWLILYQIEEDERYLEAGRMGVEFLLSQQVRESSDPNALGGIYYWHLHPIIFAWPVMFATQALRNFQQAEVGGSNLCLLEELF